ncbi:hypothetical protein OS11_17410 [Dickeya oryzae]
MSIPGRFGAVWHSAWDPDGAIGRHDPDVIFGTANYRAIQGNNQLPFTVCMYRHFCRVINEIQMTRDCGAGCGVRIKQRIGEWGQHSIGNI